MEDTISVNWAKEHRKEITEKIITESAAYTQDSPMAIIMAGLPGAGKTEISKQLIALSGISFVRIDMDELASFLPKYRPAKADVFRLPATILLNELLATTIKYNLDIIVDGTFSSKYALENVRRLINHGYSVKVVYVAQQPKLAWEYTKAREKIEHRAIKLAGFIQSYYNTIKNIKQLPSIKIGEPTLDLVLKRPNNVIGQWFSDIDPIKIDDYVEHEYNITKLKANITGEDHDS